MPLLWLRVATVLYGVGLIHAILMLRQRGERSGRIAAPAVCLGMVFHFVSLVETAVLFGYAELLNIRHAESALALIIAIIFTHLFVRYKTASPAAFIFPLIFLLTFASAIAQHRVAVSLAHLPQRLDYLPRLHPAVWLCHALPELCFQPAVPGAVAPAQAQADLTWAARMPALQEIDELGYKALLLGFPFMTVGLLAGAVVAQERYGPTYFTDPEGAALAADVGHLSGPSLHPLECRAGAGRKPPIWPALDLLSQSAPGVRIT